MIHMRKGFSVFVKFSRWKKSESKKEEVRKAEEQVRGHNYTMLEVHGKIHLTWRRMSKEYEDCRNDN